MVVDVTQIEGSPVAIASCIQGDVDASRLFPFVIIGRMTAAAVEDIDTNAVFAVFRALADIEVSVNCAPAPRDTVKSRVGVSSARLGTKLIVPPTVPFGGRPPKSALGPLMTSTRSTASTPL